MIDGRIMEARLRRCAASFLSMLRHFGINLLAPHAEAAFDAPEILESLPPQLVQRRERTHSHFAGNPA